MPHLDPLAGRRTGRVRTLTRLLPAALALGGCVVAQPYPVAEYGYAAPSNTAAGVATGAVAGGLLGAAIAGPGDRGAGAVGGAAAGALIGGLIGNAADRREAEAWTYGQPAYGQAGYGYPGQGYTGPAYPPSYSYGY